MRDILDLDRYPLDRPDTADWTALVEHCRIELAENGMFNLAGIVRPEALERAVSEVKPVLDAAAFTHKRMHNIYFEPEVPNLDPDHPALHLFETVNHTICADQIPDSVPMRIYEWPPFRVFLAATMDKPELFVMADPLARVNVMAYRAGEGLNWHFDRCEFTTTLLLQEPEAGGELEYCSNLRSDDNPNYDGIARLLAGRNREAKILKLTAGTLNIFRGINTPHRVLPVEGGRERIMAVFSYYERPDVLFSSEERLGFYGRAA